MAPAGLGMAAPHDRRLCSQEVSQSLTRADRAPPGVGEPHQGQQSPTREPEGLTTQEEADVATLCRTLAAEHFQFRLVGTFVRISQQERSQKSHASFSTEKGAGSFHSAGQSKEG